MEIIPDFHPNKHTSQVRVDGTVQRDGTASRLFTVGECLFSSCVTWIRLTEGVRNILFCIVNHLYLSREKLTPREFYIAFEQLRIQQVFLEPLVFSWFMSKMKKRQAQSHRDFYQCSISFCLAGMPACLGYKHRETHRQTAKQLVKFNKK